jgi:hypothetical protein
VRSAHPSPIIALAADLGRLRSDMGADVSHKIGITLHRSHPSRSLSLHFRSLATLVSLRFYANMQSNLLIRLFLFFVAFTLVIAAPVGRLMVSYLQRTAVLIAYARYRLVQV